MAETLTCKLFSATSHLRLQMKEYLQHIKLFHAYQPDFKVTCGINGCQRTYTNFGTFHHHVDDVHTDGSTTDPFEFDSVNAISVDCDEDHTSNDDDYASGIDDDCSAMLDGCDNHDEPCCSQDMHHNEPCCAEKICSHGFTWIKGKIQAYSSIPARCYTKHDSSDSTKHEHFEIKGCGVTYKIIIVNVISSLDLWSFEYRKHRSYTITGN